MISQLEELVKCWMVWGGIDTSLAPDRGILKSGFDSAAMPFRPGADPHAIAAWEHRHGFQLPAGLRAWLMLSNGLYHQGPLIHPITAIGPMVPFARVPDLIVQPESWFELGNPNVETICIDLAYRWPGGGHPIFTSGDDLSQSPPRIIARSFEEWFLELLRQGGREYWFDPEFSDFGDPWTAHRRHLPPPPLPDRLRPFADRVRPLMEARAEERTIASSLGISPNDVEILLRHLQHTVPDWTPS
jgi:hypothetical protein